MNGTLRDRLLDGIYRTQDWDRLAKHTRPGQEGENALALYDGVFFTGLSSYRDCQLLIGGATTENVVPSTDALASHTLIMGMVESQDQFRLMKASETGGHRKVGSDVVIPLFMEAVERRLQDFNSRQRALVIEHVDSRLFNTVRFVSSARSYFDKLDAKTQKEERATFHLGKNPRFYAVSRRLDATLRASAYDVARRELCGERSEVVTWAEMTDADLAAIADLVFCWLYGTGYRKMGVRANEWHEKQPTQRADLIAEPKLPYVKTKTGRRIDPYTAVMRQELKRIRHRKQGNPYPKPVGDPHVEVVDDNHPLLHVEVKKVTQQVMTDLRKRWEEWGCFDYDINDGSTEKPIFGGH